MLVHNRNNEIFNNNLTHDKKKTYPESNIVPFIIIGKSALVKIILG
jgi:hypothetical protein